MAEMVRDQLFSMTESVFANSGKKRYYLFLLHPDKETPPWIEGGFSPNPTISTADQPLADGTPTASAVTKNLTHSPRFELGRQVELRLSAHLRISQVRKLRSKKLAPFMQVIPFGRAPALRCNVPGDQDNEQDDDEEERN